MLKSANWQLGNLEIAVLECLWTIGEADPKTVHATISKKRRVTHNTVQSTLERLYRKGLLTREKISHSYRYRSAYERAALAALLIEGVTEVLGKGNAGPMLAAFVDVAQRLDSDALDELEQLIAGRKPKVGDPK